MEPIDGYTVLSSGKYGRGAKEFIGVSSPRKCRFCGKDENETEFNNLSHAIPEFLGNKQLILHEECDQCNTYFSENIEDHYDKFTKPIRTALQIKGKRKIPTYKGPNDSSRMQISKDGVLQIYKNTQDLIINEIDDETLKLSLHIEPYIPQQAYRALVKFALSIVQDQREFANFSTVAKWVRYGKIIDDPAMTLPLFEAHPTGGIKSGGVSTLMLRQKYRNPKIPYALFAISFGGVVHQVSIPSNEEISENRQIEVSDIPQIGAPLISYEIINMNGHLRQSSTRTMTLKHEGKTPIEA